MSMSRETNWPIHENRVHVSLRGNSHLTEHLLTGPVGTCYLVFSSAVVGLQKFYLQGSASRASYMNTSSCAWKRQFSIPFNAIAVLRRAQMPVCLCQIESELGNENEIWQSVYTGIERNISHRTSFHTFCKSLGYVGSAGWRSQPLKKRTFL